MIKKIIKDGYTIEYPDTTKYSQDEIDKMIDDTIALIKRKEAKDTVEDVEDEAYLVHPDGTKVKRGDHVISFRDEGAIVIDWELPRFEGKSGRVHVKWDDAPNEEAARGSYYPEVFGLKWVGLPWQKDQVSDIKVEDVPVNAPEENVAINYTEKLKGGKSPLTSGMIEEAFKQRSKDEGKTFEAYVDAVIASLKEDIANAQYIVSGEMKPVRSLLLEDYIKIEHLVEKAGLSDKLAEMKPLVDELSEKLNLNYFKKPKFKKSEMKSAAKELRNKHKWDSTIVKSFEPVFLCSKTDLVASYNDAKQGKLPQVFEGNLIKVGKDLEADYERINQGRDTYLEDPRIVKVLPKIVDLYETATKYAEELGYEEMATRFAYMLNTIKKGWGLE